MFSVPFGEWEGRVLVSLNELSVEPKYLVLFMTLMLPWLAFPGTINSSLAYVPSKIEISLINVFSLSFLPSFLPFPPLLFLPLCLSSLSPLPLPSLSPPAHPRKAALGWEPIVLHPWYKSELEIHRTSLEVQSSFGTPQVSKTGMIIPDCQGSQRPGKSIHKVISEGRQHCLRPQITSITNSAIAISGRN